jgi:5-carboxymethyl-2-hydroxymuconate isomerase
MPHFVIEYAREVEQQVVLSELHEITHQAGASSGLIKPEDIKVRAHPYDYYETPGAKNTFVHTTIFLLERRTDEQKEKLSNTL